MKVILVSTSLPNGGKERQMIELIKGLKANSIDFKIISFSKENYVVGLEIFYDRFEIFDRKQGEIKAFINYIKYIFKYRPDIIHSWDHLSTLYSVIPKILSRFKLIDGSIRGAKPFFRRKFFIFLTKPFSNFIVANSLAGLMSANLKESRKNIVIYNGIDLTRFDHIKVAENSSVERINIGTIANLRPAKDYKTFVNVAKHLVNLNSNIFFTSIGEGKLDKETQDVVDEFSEKEKNQIVFLGRKTNVEEYISKFDICLLLSDPNYGSEGISNSIMEYMALGKPVIATNTGGTPEIVKEGISGFLIDPFDSHELIKKITYLIDNRKIILKMGREGEKIIMHRFNLDTMVQRYIELYTSK